jgi:hypothetical protein
MTQRRRTSNLFALLITTFTLIAQSAQAQGAGDGSIRGRVADAQGAPLPGVTITATSPNVGGTFSAVSDSEGNYRLINLTAGAGYQVTAALEASRVSSARDW